MSMGIYIGNEGIAKKVTKIYTGINNVAKKVKKIYLGDAQGKAKLIWRTAGKYDGKFASEIDLNKTLGSTTTIATLTFNNIENFISEHGINNGDFEGLALGNIINIQDGTYNVDWYIVGFNTELNSNTALGSYGKNHITLMPVKYLTKASMNSSNSNTSGYYGSTMNQTTCKSIAAKLQTALGNHLLPHKETLSSNSSSTTVLDEVLVIIPNSMQVAGTMQSYCNGTFANGDDNYQLPGFAKGLTKNTASYTWLRDTYGSSSYSVVEHISGLGSTDDAATSNYIRPLIIIG